MQYETMKVRCGFCMTGKHDDCRPLIASPAGQVTWVCTCECATAQEAAKLLEDDKTSEDSTEIELDDQSSERPMQPQDAESTGPSVEGREPKGQA